MKTLCSSAIMAFLLGISLLYGQTGFTDNFQSDPGWKNNYNYSSYHLDSIQCLEVHKDDDAFATIIFDLPDTINISSNPYLNIKARTEKPIILSLYLFDETNTHSNINKRVQAVGDFKNICFDFSSASIDLTKISSFRIAINPFAKTFNGIVYFDDLLIGTDAIKMANIGGISNQVYYKNTGAQSILITDIENATAVTATGGGSLIQNIDVSSISAENTAVLTYDLVTDATGTENVTITADGLSGYADNSYTFELTIEDNQEPTLDSVFDIIIPVESTHTINLTGISDGNIAAEQTLTITAISSQPTAIPDPSINYEQGSPYANLVITPVDTISNANITVTIEDTGTVSNTYSRNFKVTAIDSFNYKPTLDQPEDIVIRYSNKEQSIILTGISDGDDGEQNISITASSSNSSVISNDSLQISYSQGNDYALLLFNPDSIGKTTISVMIQDDGETANNNGNEVLERKFDINVLSTRITGHVVPMDEFDTVGNNNFEFYNVDNNMKWRLEGNLYNQTATLGSYHGKNNVVRLDLDEKSCWTGLWYDCPDIDMSNHPYMTYDIYFEGDNFDASGFGETHAYFWDENMERNIEGAHLERKTLPVDTWHTVLFDFRQEGKLDINNEDREINVEHVQKILFNYASSFDFTTPPDNGSVYITNIKLGSAVPDSILPPYSPPCTIDPIANQTHYINSGNQSILLTGITDGNHNTANVSLSTSSNNASFIPAPTVSEVNTNGEATLYYSIPATIDSATISVIASASGATDNSISFKIFSMDTNAIDTIFIDASQVFQTIDGFGMDLPKKRFNNLFTNELGASAVRLKIMENQIESVNDNNNPDVLFREALSDTIFDWEYLKQLKANGIETFLLSIYSPPAWMKDNYSTNYFVTSVKNWENTDNRMSTYYYTEFAETCVAIIKIFKQEAGIQLDAISLQNNPAHCYEYSSAVLSPTKYVELISIVGAKFQNENITTKIVMPEQLFDLSSYPMADHMDSVQANPIANQYTDIFAVHDFDNDGMVAGAPDFNQWINIWDKAHEGTHPKPLWMTHTINSAPTWNGAMSLSGAIYGALSSGNISLWNWGAFNKYMYKDDAITPLFYTSKHFYKFIKPGAKRLYTNDNDDIMSLAFKNDSAHGNNITLVITNKGTIPYTISDKTVNDTSIRFYQVYQTSENNYFNELKPKKPGESLILPPKSITTLAGIANLPPTINKIDDQYIIAGEGDKTINLTGITDGGEGEQHISVSAYSPDNTVISNISVIYTSPDDTGKLILTPENVPGESAIITVKVKVDSNSQFSSDSTMISFMVNIFSDYNNPPTIAPVGDKIVYEDCGLQTILLTGLSDGDSGTQDLSISATSSNHSVISSPGINYTNGSDSALLSFIPQQDKYGVTTINVLVEDDGGSLTNNGDQHTNEQFIIEVLPVNDPPTIDPIQGDTVYINDGPQEIYLSGISDGDLGSNQNITLSAQLSNPDIISTFIAYTQGQTTGTLFFTPESTGITKLSIIVKDDGGTSNGGIDTTITSCFVKITGPYDVTFNVTDLATSLPVSGAEVNLNGYANQYTNTSGITVFNDVFPENNITYDVSASGYTNHSGSLSVINDDVVIDISLSEYDPNSFNITFTVLDTSLSPVAGAEVNLKGYGNKSTNSQGEAFFTNIAPEYNIPYTVNKLNYQSFEGNVDVIDSDVNKQLQLIEYPAGTQRVIFHVHDKKLNEIQGATINLDGYGSKKTDIEGKASFHAVYPADSIEYFIFADGYISQYNTLSVIDTTIQQTITLQKNQYNILFVITDNRGLSVEEASVMLLGESKQYTDKTGQLQFDSLLAFNDYVYTVNKNKHSVVVDTVKNLMNNHIEHVTLINVSAGESTSNHFKYYPNPANEFLVIKNDIPIQNIRMTNIIGESIFERDNINTRKTKITLKNFEPGYYIIHCIDREDNHYSGNIMIIH